jgi:hypothetical protein
MMQTNRGDMRSSPALTLLTRWFAMSQSARHAQPDMNSDRRLNPGYQQPECGAYNEAFVMQY